MRRKRYKQWLLRGIFFLLLFAVCLGVIFYFLPLSGTRLDERLTRVVKEAIGRDVMIRGVCFYLSRGRLEIQEMTLPPPDKSGIPLVFQDVSINFSLYGFLFSKPDRWCEIQLTCPTEILLLFQENRFVIPPGYKYLGPFLSEIVKRGSESGSLPVTKAEVNMRNIFVAYESAAPEGLFVRPVVKLKTLSLGFSFQKGRLALITAKGVLHSEIEGELSGLLSFDPDGTPDRFLLFLSQILLSENTFPNSRFRLDGKNLRMSDNLDVTRSLISFRHEISLDSVSLLMPGLAKPFVENQIRIMAEGEMNGGNKQLNIRTAKISLSDSEILLKGEMELAGEFPFSATMEQHPISRRTLDLLKQVILPRGWDVTLQQQSLTFLFHAAGDLVRPGDIQFHGNLRFADIALRHQDFPLPLTDLSGEISMDQSTLSLKNVRGKLGEGVLSLEGRLEGTGNFFPPEKASLSWSADFPIQNLGMMIRNKIPLDHWKLTGQVNTRGSLEMRLIARDRGTTVSLTRFDADVTVSDASLRHPFLPEEVRNISGRFHIQPDVVQFQELKGSFPEGTATLQGRVIGDKYFWKAPVLSVEVMYNGGLTPLIQMIPSHLRETLHKAHLNGDVFTTTYLTLPLDSPDKISYYGDASINNVSFQALHPSLNGVVENLGGTIRFEKENILFKELHGNFAGSNFALEGRMGPEILQMKIAGHLVLEKLREALPNLADDFRATGTVELKSDFSLSAENLLQSLLLFEFPKDRQLDFSGAIESDDAAFAYRDMPVDLHHIKGRVAFDDTGLRFKDVHLWCGNSPDCTGEGEIVFSSKPLVCRFKVQVPTLYFKEWTGPWKSLKSSKSSFITMQDLTSASPSVEVEGTVLADTIHYGRLEGRNFQGRFIYSYFLSGPNKYSFDNAKVEAYGGKAMASGNLLFPSGNFYYGVEGEAESMDLQEVLTALRGRKQNLSGVMTASLTLAGESQKPETISSKVSIDLQQSRFIGNMIFVGLGRALKSTLFDDITFTRVQGELDIKNGVADFKDLKFTSPLVNLNASGTVDFHENLDVICFLMFEKKNILGLPLLRQFAQILEYMGKAILKFHIKGTLEKPDVNAIALSTDEIRKFFFGY